MMQWRLYVLAGPTIFKIYNKGLRTQDAQSMQYRRQKLYSTYAIKIFLASQC